MGGGAWVLERGFIHCFVHLRNYLLTTIILTRVSLLSPCGDLLLSVRVFHTWRTDRCHPRGVIEDDINVEETDLAQVSDYKRLLRRTGCRHTFRENNLISDRKNVL